VTAAIDVVVVSHEGDLHGDHVCQALERRGARIWRTSLTEFPKHEISWEPGSALTIDSRIVQPGTRGYFRRPGMCAIRFDDRAEQLALEEEIEAAFYGLLDALPVDWLDAPANIIAAESKLLQLSAVTRAGFQVPRTVVTNAESQVRTLCGASPVVVKAMGGGTIEYETHRVVLYTTAFDPTEETLASLTVHPLLLQTRVEAGADVRVITVSDRVFAAQRPRLRNGAVDWREPDPQGVDFEPLTDPALERDAVRLARVLGLEFSAQDWLQTPEGHVFLEANPAGQWLFLPAPLSGAVTSAVADALLK